MQSAWKSVIIYFLQSVIHTNYKQLLTNNGWTAVQAIEGVLLQVRMAMSSNDPPARLENGGRGDYGVGEAVEAYIRACNTHRWAVPPGFREMAYGGAPQQQGYDPY